MGWEQQRTDDGEEVSSRRQITDLGKAKSKFWSILQEGMTNIMSDAREVWNGQDSADYQVERKVLSQMYQPVIWGMWTTCLCFTTFRVAGSKWFQQFRRFGVTAGRQSANHPRDQSTSKQWKSYSERQMDDHREILNKAMSLPTDLALSVMLGVSVTGLTVRPEVLTRDFETAPLLPGKSLTSKNFCMEMTNLHHRIGPNLREMEDHTLESLLAFVENCRKRQEVEERLRNEMGLFSDEPVSIPERIS